MVIRRHDPGLPKRRSRLRLPSLPVKLGAPPPRLRPFLSALWLACLALVIVAQAGEIWRVYEDRRIEAPFASLGLAHHDARQWVSVSPISRSARATGMQFGNLRAIDGRAIPASEGTEEFAQRLVGPDGAWVTLRLVPPGGRHLSQTVTLQRSGANRAEVDMARTWLDTYSPWIDVAVAFLLVGAATVFRIRCFRDPVAILLSFALLFLATVGTQDFWRWFGLYHAENVLEGIWITLLLAAIPALPSGRYAPPWTRWLVLAGPAGEAVIASGAEVRLELVWGLLILMTLSSVYLRFKHTSRSAERQKMKWASLGLGVGLLLYAAGHLMVMYHASLPFSGEVRQGLAVGGYAINRAAFLIMALGMLVSLLGYRLNDADAAIAWAAGYATITTLLALVWAASAAWSDRLIRLYTRDSAELAAAISTLIAIAIFSPARSRAMAWTDAWLQPALVRLRGLPERIARWQNDDDPAAVAARALKTIAEGVDAVNAALVACPAGGPPRVIGRYKVGEDAVRARLRKRRPHKPADDEFPLRVGIESDAEAPMTLLVGRRGDSAYYSKQERVAVAAVATPLADALHAAARGAERRAALDAALTRLDRQLRLIDPLGRQRHARRREDSTDR